MNDSLRVRLLGEIEEAEARSERLLDLASQLAEHGDFPGAAFARSFAQRYHRLAGDARAVMALFLPGATSVTEGGS